MSDEELLKDYQIRKMLSHYSNSEIDKQLSFVMQIEEIMIQFLDNDHLKLVGNLVSKEQSRRDELKNCNWYR